LVNFLKSLHLHATFFHSGNNILLNLSLSFFKSFRGIFILLHLFIAYIGLLVRLAGLIRLSGLGNFLKGLNIKSFVFDDAYHLLLGCLLYFLCLLSCVYKGFYFFIRDINISGRRLLHLSHLIGLLLHLLLLRSLLCCFS